MIYFNFLSTPFLQRGTFAYPFNYVTATPFFKGRLGGIELILQKHVLRIYTSLKIKVNDGNN